MKKMSATEFKAKCLAVLDEVGESGARVVVTKRGKPVAELSRYVESPHAFPQEALRGSGRIIDDIEAPAVSPADWTSVGAIVDTEVDPHADAE